MTDSAEKMRAHKHVTLNADGDIWTAGIDIRENNGDWHYSAVECHSVDRELAIARRDTVFAALSASGTKSDGTTEGRGRYAEQPGSALSCAAPRNGGAPPTEAVAGIKPGPSDPISSQPDEREAIAEQLQGWADFIDTEAAQSMSVASAAYANGGSLADDLRSAILAMLAERRGATPVVHAINGPFASPISKMLVDDPNSASGKRLVDAPLPPAPIVGLEPVAWRYWWRSKYLTYSLNEPRPDDAEPLYTRAQLEAHAAEQVRPLVEALEGLIEAVELDADEGLEGIGSYTGARLTDAKNAIRARGQV